MLLFANYKTVVEKVGDGKNAKSKASGGRRVLYTAHHPAGMPKNRFDLPEEVPLTMPALPPASPAQCLHRHQNRNRSRVPSRKPTSCPSLQQEAKPVAQPQPAPRQESPRKMFCLSLGVLEAGCSDERQQGQPEELQGVGGKRGYFPRICPSRTTLLTL